jgi:hypothetical protein
MKAQSTRARHGAVAPWTTRRCLAALGAVLLLLLSSRVASAAPLTAVALDQLQVYVDCSERCALGRVATQTQCQAACGTPSATWNKNTDNVVNRRDFQLALMEFANPASICYEGGAVVPKGQCGGSNCLATHTAAQCADADGDGIKAWQEALVSGMSDNVAQTPCTSGLQCNGFAQQCFYEEILDLSYCKARSVTSAFHLEKIEENAEEVTVALVFDYSPVPPSVMDLYVTYNGAALTLTESRALAAAKSAGKDVQVRHVGDNLLRVIVLGAADARVIQPGRVAELVFRRKTGDVATIQFSTDGDQRQHSMAPTPGGFGVALREDSAWGSSVTLKSGSDPTEGRTLLHYDFDSAERPLALSTAKPAATLCDQVRLTSTRSTLAGDCPVEPAIPPGGVNDPQYASSKLKRDRWISQLSALQAGTVVTTRAIEGVNGSAAWFDGENDHVAFPLTFNQPASAGGDFTEARQSFSLSFWAYREPSASAEQVLYSRNVDSTEITKFALLARPSATLADKFDLVWLSGNLTGGTRTVLSEGLPDRKWTHIGISVAGNAPGIKVNVYVDGRAVGSTITLATGALVTCPSIDNSLKKRMTLHQEGDLATVQGTGPESLFFSAAGSNGLYGIEAADPNGLGRRAILRLAGASAKDPDYNPVVDRVVYSSNESGNSEIWIAGQDGSQTRRITSGFGSTADGIFARRPRWAPDGSGIVFESNARDLERSDNVEGAGYHLFYIPYDPIANAVAIPGPSNSVLSVLDYVEQVAAGKISSFRLTRHTEAFSNTGAQWLSGSGTGDLARGELAYTATEPNGSNPRVRRVRIAKSYLIGGGGAGPDPAAEATADARKELLAFTADPSLVQNRTLLAARGSRRAGQPTSEKALLAAQEVVDSAATDFSATVTAAGTCSSGGSAFNVSVRYVGGGSVTEFYGLFVGYSQADSKPEMSSVVAGSWLDANAKTFRASQVFGATDAVRIEVTSPVNATPIPTNTEVARMRFCGATSPTVSLKKKIIKQSFSTITITTAENTPPSVVPGPFELHDPRIQSVTSAEFSPDLSRLALGVIFDARPTLFRTAGLSGTAGADQLLADPARVEGISWSSVERFYHCNWIGAVRNPTSKLYQGAFQGGLEDVKLVDYVRTADAFAAESERGHERLKQAGRDDPTPTVAASCAIDTECGTGDLCVSGKCQRVSCVATNPAPCARGRCQRLPLELASTEQYACTAECVSDSTCMEKQCANGPCRFCDSAALTCSECRVVDGAVQGCPDRNSYACDRGSCVSACYSTVSGESKYLCDPATEYCRAGRCVLFDWNWADLGPMSLVGAGEMAAFGVKPTAAISQLYRIQIQALGVADLGHPPELLVEGKAPGVAGGDWFDIGRIVVDNETNAEATSRPYVVNTPYPVTTLRLRTILPPYENLTQSAMGLLDGRAGEFCTAAQGAACRFRATGSRALLGYEAWIPGHLSKCKLDSSKCNAEQNKFLGAGTPVALVLDVKVKNDTSQPLSSWVNRICPYWTGSGVVSEPVKGNGDPNWLIYGDASRELSNQKTKYYPTATATALQSFNAQARGFGVLNCNYVDDTGGVAAIAGIEVPVVGVSYPAGGQFATEGNVRESANGCLVDQGTPQVADYRACYEWDGAEVSFDPFASTPIPYRTLTLAQFSSFGWGVLGDKAP